MPVEECSKRRAQNGRGLRVQSFFYENFLRFQQNVLLASSQNRMRLRVGLRQFATYDPAVTCEM